MKNVLKLFGRNLSLSPLLHMELSKIKSDVVTQINNLNTRSIQNNFSYIWQPHNYRLNIPYNRKFLNTILLNKVVLKKLARYVSHTKMYFYKGFVNKKNYQITIEIGSDSITSIYSSKKWYRLQASSLNEINNMINNRVVEIEDNCIEAVKNFIKKYKGKAYYNEKRWSRHEDGLKGDEFLDKLPGNLIIQDKTFKKVYQDKVEFKSPVYMQNFINNRALENIAPEIAARLDKFTEAINLEIYNKRLHMKILNDISATMKHLNSNILRVKYSGRRLSGLERMLIK